MDSLYIYLICAGVLVILFLFYYYRCSNYNMISENLILATPQPHMKIAFLFLTYDDINNEDVWQSFFKNADPNDYNIYIHSKNKGSVLSAFNKYKIANTIDTAWGDISLVKAQNLLLTEALKDENNQFFILLSNSCIPFKTFDNIKQNLSTKLGKSIFNMSSDSQIFPRCDNTLKYTKKEYIKKASQWSILSRNHAEILAKDENIYLDWFNYPGTIADEHAYITYLYSKGLQDELIQTNNLTNGATTFIHWSDMYYEYADKWKGQVSYGAKEYDNIDTEEIDFLFNSPCLFGRKFKKGCKNLDALIKRL